MLPNKRICGIVLLALISVSIAIPLQRERRSIIKDYFNPLRYPTIPLLFKKGEDGKYHLKKNSEPMSSTVEYVLANDDISNEIVKPLEPEQSSKLTEDINTESEKKMLEPPKEIPTIPEKGKKQLQLPLA
ncbi:hypothetical protein CEXT_753161 [Caerostris extrusa]|uniref:Uncharacterized protein n=1 Tax=Caerostris extrusa TaxID=172846 RepID=A0AAV4W0X4_CAEEX|nr:hypothetical protein CEXT_753161 [Caerostris extrusa]